MKKYNIQNYVRWKHDLSRTLNRLPDLEYHELSRNQLIERFLPLVENLARKFSTAQAASGVMTINDLIQEGNYGLTAGADRIDWDTILEAKDQEKTLKSFLSKRIKGAIRRGIDSNRGSMRIPEHKLNEIRKDLLIGDVLIDDTRFRGQPDFQGNWFWFNKDWSNRNWNACLEYIKTLEKDYEKV